MYVLCCVIDIIDCRFAEMFQSEAYVTVFRILLQEGVLLSLMTTDIVSLQGIGRTVSF
jgi:hypothetical protein